MQAQSAIPGAEIDPLQRKVRRSSRVEAALIVLLIIDGRRARE